MICLVGPAPKGMAEKPLDINKSLCAADTSSGGKL
jgi:hypothetical protein